MTGSGSAGSAVAAGSRKGTAGVRQPGVQVTGPNLLVHVGSQQAARQLRTLAVGLGMADQVHIVVGAAAPYLSNGTPPGLVVLDGDMTVTARTIVIRRLRRRVPSAGFLICHRRAVRAGAVPASGAGGGLTLAAGVVPVVAGMLIWRSVQASATSRPGPRWAGGQRAEARPRPLLTSREVEVLRHVAEGKSNRRIGEDIFVSEQTVKTHIRRILRKVGAEDRTEAVAEGFRRGLLS